MNTLIFLVIVFLCIGLVAWLLNAIPIPAPWGMLAHVALVLIAIFLLLGLLVGAVTVPQILS